MSWWTGLSRAERATFFACFGGWALERAIGLLAASACAVLLVVAVLLPETRGRELA